MSISEWINETFFGMDASIFRFTNEMLNENPFIFKIARFISYFGDHGIFFIALAVVLLAFRKTRKVGILLACGLAFNHVLNNMIIKNLVARARPYDEVMEFEEDLLIKGLTAVEKEYGEEIKEKPKSLIKKLFKISL